MLIHCNGGVRQPVFKYVLLSLTEGNSAGLVWKTNNRDSTSEERNPELIASYHCRKLKNIITGFRRTGRDTHGKLNNEIYLVMALRVENFFLKRNCIPKQPTIITRFETTYSAMSFRNQYRKSLLACSKQKRTWCWGEYLDLGGTR